jgi:hypothetical protein
MLLGGSKSRRFGWAAEREAPGAGSEMAILRQQSKRSQYLISANAARANSGRRPASLRCTIPRMQFKRQIILDSDPWIRDYFEVVCDTTPTTQSIVGFICKVCWRQFENSGSALSLLAHAEMHKARQERPYQTHRRLFFSGEDILERYRILTEHFAVVTPEAGTWKFRCCTCSKVFPHRTECDELIEHGTRCQVTRMAAMTQ